MATKSSFALALAFAGAFLAVGIPYWQIPYQQVGLPGDVWTWGLVVVAGFALVLRAIPLARFWSTMLVVGAAVPAAVFARVVVEGIADPTSHNVWPLELILTAGPGFLMSAAGALVGLLVARSRGAA